jgi:hypothetical protein
MIERIREMRAELELVLDDDLSDATDEMAAELAEEFGIDVDWAYNLLTY